MKTKSVIEEENDTSSPTASEKINEGTSRDSEPLGAAPCSVFGGSLSARGSTDFESASQVAQQWSRQKLSLECFLKEGVVHPELSPPSEKPLTQNFESVQAQVEEFSRMGLVFQNAQS